MEMRLWRCLSYLAQTGMGANRTGNELEKERLLVVGARIWLGLFHTEYQCVWLAFSMLSALTRPVECRIIPVSRSHYHQRRSAMPGTSCDIRSQFPRTLDS